MNVLYITYDGMLDAVSRSQVIPYVERLAGVGNRMTVLSFEKLSELKNNAAVVSLKEELAAHSIDWVRKKYHKSPAVPATIFDIAQGVFAGAFLVKKRSISIVHARGYIPMIMACMLKSFFKVKVIFDMRGFWPEEKVDAGAWKEGGMLYKVFKMTEIRMLKNADEIVVLTEAAKRIVKSRGYGAHISVIPCCVDTGFFKLSPKSPAPLTIVYAGSLGTFYNLDRIFEFFGYVKVARKDAFLSIASQFPVNLVRKSAVSMNIDEASYSVDRFTHAQMPEVFSSADFSIIFYNRRLSGAGCFPIKLSESLACGVPVIVNRGIGDCDEMLEKNGVGVVLKGFSAAEYNEVLKKMQGLLVRGEDMRKRCRALAESLFPIEKGVKDYNKIYQDLGRPGL